MNPFSYHGATSIEDGLRVLAEATPANSRLLAGGTDLLPLMKSGIERPQMLIGLRRISDLPADIKVKSDGTRLGALATLAQIARHPILAEQYPALTQAAQQAASPQLRNMATLGGTLLQRPRCEYFRSPGFHCWLKGGTVCHARTGSNEDHAVFDTGVCRAAHPSDLACALAALDAEVELMSRRGLRCLPLVDFIQPPDDARRSETVLAAEELIVAVRLPSAKRLGRSIFLKTMKRNAWSFAQVSVAARLSLRAGLIESIEVVLGAVATTPWSIGPRLKALRNEPYNDARMMSAVRSAIDDAQPLSMNAYKLPLARALTERALRTLASEGAAERPERRTAI